MADTERDDRIRSVILIEGCINLLLLCAKLVVGLTTNSFAILADAAHSLTDLANNFISWFILRVAGQPPDEDHPYGHRKFEVLAVFVLATLLSVIALELVIRSFTRSTESNIYSSTTLLVLMLVVLSANLGTVIWQKIMAKRLGSRILEADADHTLADVLTTVGVIIGWQFAANGYPLLDAITTLVVAAMIAWMSFSLFRSTLPVLLDQVAVPAEEIATLATAVPGVTGVKRIRSRWIGEAIAIDLVIMVAPEMTTMAAHEIADQIEVEIDTTFAGAETTIHVEPDSP